MRIRVKLGLVLAVAACSGTPERVAHPVTHACESSAQPSRPAVRRLVATVAALDAAPRTDDHVALLGAMRSLGASLELVAAPRTAELERVRTMTQALERAIGNPDARAGFVLVGLVSAGHALEAVSPRYRRSRCYRTGVDALAEATSRIAPDRRLAAQYPQVRAALHAASAAVLAAEGSSTVAGR
jgi:hypothetical protein